MLPPYFLFFGPFGREDVGLHSSSEQALIFLEITDVYLVFHQLLPPLHFEVEPLQVAGCVAVYSHEAVVLAFSYLHYTVQIAPFEKGVKEEVIFSFPVLSTKGTIGKFDIIGCFDVRIGKGKIFIVPCVEGVLIAWAEVDYFGFGPRLFERLLDELVVAVAFKDDGYGGRKIQFGVPAACRHFYPVSRSGLRE